MRRTRSASLLIGLLTVLLSCTAVDVSEDTGVSIRGSIIEVHHTEAGNDGDHSILGAVLIEGVFEGDTQIQSASISITVDTEIYEQRGSERSQVAFEVVAVGQSAQVRFAGPVMETYPIQGTAAELLIVVEDQ